MNKQDFKSLMLKVISKNCFIFLFAFILLIVQTTCGQTKQQDTYSGNIQKVDERVNNLKSQAQELFDAFDKKDFEKFVELTHSKIIEKVGGKEKMFLMMKKLTEQNSEIFESFTSSVENPDQLIEFENQLFGVVPHKLEGITFNKNKVVTLGSTIGVSVDNGKTWKFVNGTTFKEIFPKMIDKVQIPLDKTFVNGKEQ